MIERTWESWITGQVNLCLTTWLKHELQQTLKSLKWINSWEKVPKGEGLKLEQVMEKVWIQKQNCR